MRHGVKALHRRDLAWSHCCRTVSPAGHLLPWKQLSLWDDRYTAVSDGTDVAEEANMAHPLRDI